MAPSVPSWNVMSYGVQGSQTLLKEAYRFRFHDKGSCRRRKAEGRAPTSLGILEGSDRNWRVELKTNGERIGRISRP